MIDSIKLFIEALKTDSEFSDRLVRAASREERTQIVKKTGCTFTKEELSKARGELTAHDAPVPN